MKKVVPLAGDLVVEAGPMQPLLFSIPRPELLARKPTVQTPEAIQVLPQRLRRDHLCPRTATDNRSRFEAEIDADHVAQCSRARENDLALPFDPERDEPTIRATLDRRREDTTVEPPLRARLLEPNPSDQRQIDMSLTERDLIDAC
jgi:hypothetical protein